MKAIIIQDHDCKALIEKLQLEKLKDRPTVFIPGATPEQVEQFNKVYGRWIQDVKNDLYSSFHFVVVRWLQEQGANLI